MKARAITGFVAALHLLVARGRTRDAGAPTPAPPPAVPPAPAVPAAGPAAAPHPAPHQAGGPDWGEPDLPKLGRLVRQRGGDIRRCYESALSQDARTRGKATLRFTIAPGGGVEDVSVARSTFARKDVPACIVDVVRRWKTPFRPSEPVAVEYPFSFSPR